MRVTCGESRYDVTLRDARGGVEVGVDGAAFRLDVREVVPGTFLLRNDGRTQTFHCVRDGDEIHLAWDGVVYRLVEEREGGRSAQRHVSGGLEAPMPGKVIKLSVAPGQQVAKGDEILVVEAMKMENAIRAPRDGIVKSVAAKLGEMVAPGTVLVELE